MALGDVSLFEEFSDEISNVHDLDADTFKMALVSDATVDLATATPNLSDFTECTAGGNYTSGGNTLTNVSFTEAAGVATFDFDDLTIAQHASNPTDARWGLVINSTQGNAAAGKVDLGSTFDMTTGPLVFQVNASGMFDLQ